MSIYFGDFLGFSIGGIHSSQLKIVRVSSGDRYEEKLSPEFKDITVNVPGGNGTYYFGTQFTQRKIQINFAFDELTEFDIRYLIQILNKDGLQELVFDETPYKHYMVKCAEPPTLKYICFSGSNHINIYKGEGVINFISYYPYALGEERRIEFSPQDGLNYLVINNTGDLPIDNLKINFEIIGNNGGLGEDFRGEHMLDGVNFSWQLLGRLIFSSKVWSFLNDNNDYSMEIDMKNHLFNYRLNDEEEKISCIDSLTGDSLFFSLPVGLNCIGFFYDGFYAPQSFTCTYRLVYY